MNKLSFGQKVAIFIVSSSLLVVCLVAILCMQIGGSTSEFSKFLREAFSVGGSYSRASELQELNEHIKKNPNDASAYAKRAKNFYYDRDYDKALADYDKAISLEPKNAEWYHGRAKVWSWKDDHKKAIADFSKSIELKPDKECFFDRGKEYSDMHDSVKALADFDRALELGYTPRVQVLVERGSVYKENGEIDKAIDVYNVAVKDKYEEFNSDDAFEELAKLKIAKGDFAGAMTVLDQFVKEAPNEDDAYEARATLHKALGNKDKARDDYTSVVKCISHDIVEFDNQEDGYYIQRRGEAYRKAGNEKAALADFKKALEHYKNASERRDNSVAELLELLGDKPAARKIKLEQIKGFTEKISNDPKDADLYHDRAGVYDEIGDLESAYKDYEQAQKLDPKSSDYKGHLAQTLLEQKKYDAATVLLKDLVKDDFKASGSWSNLAEILVLAGHNDEAIEAADKAIALNATSANPYYYKYKASKNKGDEKTARICYQQAIALEYDEDADKH